MTTTGHGIPSPLRAALRPAALSLPESGIVRVMNHGIGKQGLIPLWVGEGDVATPAFIVEAAAASMRAGETFYTLQRGLPELRDALAAYHKRLYPGVDNLMLDRERFFVTGSGMQAILIALQSIAGSGDQIVMPTPAWPNFAAAMQILEAEPVCVPMSLQANGPRTRAWRLDLDALFTACGPKTRAIFINSPSNPTGWTATRAELRAILDFTRARGLWLVADEVYNRFYYASGVDGHFGIAPSFYEIAEPQDRLIMLNTFSKNWAMTGWRVGWMNAPVEIGQVIENLVQYNTSGVAVFMQRAAVAALEQGEPFVAEQIARAARGREIVSVALSPFERVQFAKPDGAFYMLFSLTGRADSMALALRLVDEAGVGLAPGTAFGPGGEHCLRLCFARSETSLIAAMDCLTRWLKVLRV